jgi:hypothetical protein
MRYESRRSLLSALVPRRNPNSDNLDRPIARNHVALCYCKYDLRIWVESDAASTLAACGNGEWACGGANGVNCVDLYLQTKPWERADILARGRGK